MEGPAAGIAISALGGHGEQRERVLDRLCEFFDRNFGLGGSWLAPVAGRSPAIAWGHGAHCRMDTMPTMQGHDGAKVGR